MHMDDKEVEDENNDCEMAQMMNNVLDMIRLFVVLIWFGHAFHSHCLYPPFQMCVHRI